MFRQLILKYIYGVVLLSMLTIISTHVSAALNTAEKELSQAWMNMLNNKITKEEMYPKYFSL